MSKVIEAEKGNEKGLAAYLFHQGTNFNAQDYLGANYDKKNNSVTFRLWAPNADNVFLVGDFNHWNTGSHGMKKVTENGVWEIVISKDIISDESKYKYYIVNKDRGVFKSDPYANYSEHGEKNASILWNRTKAYPWKDKDWMKQRKERISTDGKYIFSCPINIYEVHLGSYKTKDGRSTKNGDAYLNYRELADELCAYAKKMSYTHIEIMPIMEHPYDGSWGYQICGYFAPTSRFGNPNDFKYFVDKLHRNDIGVILDWVPAHFPKDAHGLYEFDGMPLYEYQGRDRMEHKAWGTRCFDVGRNEVQSFLISNALYWFNEFHIDGLRMDAVASMLYLDYDRRPGEWTPNVNGGNENLEAISFIKKLNTAVFEYCPDVMMIAEESTAWPLITMPADKGGLGFNFKWNMGWANDMYDYIKSDPLFRGNLHNKLNFSFMYAFSENYILPVSHDEVVHGKCSLINKMFGSYEQKFAGVRSFACHMIGHPGKKLMFMGCEYGQFREWDYENQLEWFMLDYESHRKLQYFFEELNRFYLTHGELWEIDYSWDGFTWLCPDDRNSNTIVYERHGKRGDTIVAAINFSANSHENYEITTYDDCVYKELFNSNEIRFGGDGRYINNNPIYSKEKRIKINIAPLSAIFFKKELAGAEKHNTVYPS